MQNVHDLLKNILENGKDHLADRTGVGRRRIFGAMLRFDMRNDAFPLITTRHINIKSVVAETLWFIAGHTNNQTLAEAGCNFWTPWAVTPKSVENYVGKLVDRKIISLTDVRTILDSVPDELMDEIGPMYGCMWRYWPRHNDTIRKEETVRTIDQMPSDFVARMREAYKSMEEEMKEMGEDKLSFSEEEFVVKHYYSSIDQLGELINNLKTDPYGSRHLVTAYNPSLNPLPGFSPDENVVAGKGSLMPCHYAFQVFVTPPDEEGGKPKISLMFHMRSWDVFLGGPYNLGGYGVILKMLAHCLDFEPDELLVSAGDAHIYLNQLEAVETQLSREIRPMPKLHITAEHKDFFAFKMSDFVLEGYNPHPAIKTTPAV